MKQILTKRVIIITFLFGVFGYALKKLFNVENSTWNIMSVAMFFCLTSSLVISLFLIPKLTKRKMMVWTIFAFVLFILSLLLFYQFNKDYTKYTVIIEEFEGDKTAKRTYFIGTQYNDNTKRLITLMPYLKNDKNQLLEYVDGKNVELVWIVDSIREIEKMLSFEYIFFVLSLISSLSIVLELLKKKEIATGNNKNRK